jgi:hypothetical protein
MTIIKHKGAEVFLAAATLKGRVNAKPDVMHMEGPASARRGVSLGTLVAFSDKGLDWTISEPAVEPSAAHPQRWPRPGISSTEIRPNVSSGHGVTWPAMQAAALPVLATGGEQQ